MDSRELSSPVVLANVQDIPIQLAIENADLMHLAKTTALGERELNGWETERVKWPYQGSNRNVEHRHGQIVRGFGNKILLSLPIGAVIIPAMFVIGAYFYASKKDTLKLPASRAVPYISDIGDLKPQSGLFTFGLTLSSYFTFGVVLTRFFQVRILANTVRRWINYLALYLGILIVVGKVMVASFQISGHLIAHFLGAALYVVSTVLFISVQTFISFKEKPIVGKHRKAFLVTRCLLSATSIAGTIIFGVFLLPPFVKYNRGKFFVAQMGEWCFAVCKLLFMLTFMVDFWHLEPRFELLKLDTQRVNLN